MKHFIISSIAFFAFIGCGSSGTTTPTDSYTDVTVERGPVIGAFVVDSAGKRAMNMGEGTYRFYVDPTYPLSVYGGYIDVNRDGDIDANDTKLSFSLMLQEQNRNRITVATTLAQDATVKSYLESTYGMSEDDLYNFTPGTSAKIAAISNLVFKYAVENNITLEEINTTILESIKTDIQTQITSIESNTTDTLVNIVKTIETALVQELNISLSDANFTLINDEITASSVQERDPLALLEAMGDYNLSEDDVNGLIYMYEEEKVARDVYNYFYAKYGFRIFTNIASSEQQHMDAVKALLDKYEITYPSLAAGDFEDASLQSLYDNLTAQGDVSLSAALEVGVLIEETDIDDLNERIIDAPADVEIIYTNLLNGSYNHLNAFTKQL